MKLHEIDGFRGTDEAAKVRSLIQARHEGGQAFVMAPAANGPRASKPKI